LNASSSECAKEHADRIAPKAKRRQTEHRRIEFVFREEGQDSGGLARS
jgi:hypothetical protein